MASSIQHHGHGNWSCLPCVGNKTNHSKENGPVVMPSRQTTSNHNGEHAMQSAEEILASELNKLSVQERAQAFDDIHCVGQELQETPEMIQNSLADFEEVVQKERNAAYEMAFSQNRAYVEDPSFRLMFLRSKLYNIREAVRQMMSFLQNKAKYFGDDKIARDITVDDLDEEDKRILLSGLYHIQEEKDRTGRTIIHWFGGKLRRLKAENVIRVTYFVKVNVILPDPSAQMKGLVSVYHNAVESGEEFVMPSIDFLLTVSNATTSFPVRFSAMHVCLQSTKAGNLGSNNSLLKSVLTNISLYTKARCRIHVGSMMELQYAFRSMGIPMASFPVDICGKVRYDVDTWLYKHKPKREEIERIPSSNAEKDGNDDDDTVFFTSPTPPTSNKPSADFGEPPVALVDHQVTEENLSVASFAVPVQLSEKPTDKDVLLGRGWVIQSWPGNVKLRDFLESHSAEYDKLPRKDRKKKTIQLTQELSAKRIRFFEQNGSGEWVQIDVSEARKKVSQLFRSIRKKK